MKVLIILLFRMISSNQLLCGGKKKASGEPPFLVTWEEFRLSAWGKNCCRALLWQICPLKNTKEELSSNQLIDTTASQRSGHNDPSKYCFKIPAHNDRYVSLTSYLFLSNFLKMTCSNPIWIPVWSGQVTRLFCTIHSINLFLTDTVSSPSFLPLQTTNYKIKGKRRKGEKEKGKKEKREKKKKEKNGKKGKKERLFVCLFVLY